MAKGHSKKRGKNKPRGGCADDGSSEICRSMGISPAQYATIVHHHMQGGHAPAPAGRARSSSQARSNGRRSGHTSRATSRGPSQEPRHHKDPVKEKIKKRCKDAVDRYRSSDEFEAGAFQRADFMAAAYQLESEKDPTPVLDHLLSKGRSGQEWYTLSETDFPDQNTDQIKQKVLTTRGKWGRMWSDGLKNMEDNDYQWDKIFSQHNLRALMIQQSRDSAH